MTIVDLAPASVDVELASLSLQMEPMESLEAPWGWGSFFAGVAAGIIIGFGVVAIGVAIT